MDITEEKQPHPRRRRERDRWFSRWRVGEDDGALRAPRGVSDGRYMPLLSAAAPSKPQPVDTPASWAPGGPEHPRLA